ncbi:MAG: hypothetical protein J6T80_03055 [Paludibacteraceae bacterium]|nr:hypothetical protein [Paludibacteraceae bacterium]
MKTKFFILSFIMMTGMISAQVNFNTSFHSIDTNGPLGECILPMNEEDDVFFSDVIECKGSSIEKIMLAVQNWLAFQQMDANLEVKDKYAGQNLLQFKGKLPIGKKFIGTPAAATFVELNWETSISDVEFICRVEVKDEKFRYTFKNFETDRWMIRGDGEGSGPSNQIHWQRVNSLTNERDRYSPSSKRYTEKDNAIKMEWAAYQMEAEMINEMVNSLRECCKEKVMEFDF